MPTPWNKGKKLSEEHKRKIGLSKKGNKYALGYKWTEEAKEKMRNRQISEETRKKMSKNSPKIWLGKKFSVETRKKMSEVAKNRQFSIETRKKLSEIHKGNKCNFWKGGISKIYKRRYFDLDYRLWREAVFDRDEYTCKKCGFKGNFGYITAHHIKSWKNYPELRYEIDNGLTLCENCHSETDNYKGRNK